MEKIINYDRMRIFCADSGLGVLIFTGIGGSLDGYNGKYNIIAKNLVERHNASVFVATIESWAEFDVLFEAAMRVVEDYYRGSNADFRLFVMGTSAGGTLAVAKAYKYAQIQKVLAVNPVIQINYNKLLDGIERANADMYFVFGDRDPSAPYIPLIARAKKENMKIDILKDVDHQFTQAFELFISLPEKYFFGAYGG